jgi:hypothetical protein
LLNYRYNHKPKISISGVTLRNINVEEGLEVADITMNDMVPYLVCRNRHTIYTLHNDTLIPCWGNWGSMGIGPKKFALMNKIRIFRNQIYASDEKNRQVQIIDTNGRFVALFPERDIMSYLFPKEEEKNLYLNDFYVSDNFLLICHGVVDNPVVDILNRKTGEKQRINYPFETIISLDANEQTNRIYVAQNNWTIAMFDFQGNFLNSIGLYGQTKNVFYSIQKIRVSPTGDLYVLDQDEYCKTGFYLKGAILVYNSDLIYRTTLGAVDNKYVLGLAKTFDFAGGNNIIVINSKGNKMFKLTIPDSLVQNYH